MAKCVNFPHFNLNRNYKKCKNTNLVKFEVCPSNFNQFILIDAQNANAQNVLNFKLFQQFFFYLILKLKVFFKFTSFFN